MTFLAFTGYHVKARHFSQDELEREQKELTKLAFARLSVSRFRFADSPCPPSNHHHPLKLKSMSTTSSTLKPLLILYGAGPGLGLSIAKAFHPSHALALLSRSLSNLKPLVQELEVDGAEVKAYESEATEEGLKKAFEQIGKDWKGRRVEVGVWNASVVSWASIFVLVPRY